MTKAEKAAMYETYLKEQGYHPTIDDDGDILVKKEGVTYIICSDEDNHFFQIICPILSLAGFESERQAVLEACGAATGEVKATKVFLRQNDVFASIEFFLEAPDGFKAVFERSLRALQCAVWRWSQAMNNESGEFVSLAAAPAQPSRRTRAAGRRKSPVVFH